MNRKIKVCFISVLAYQFFDPKAEAAGGGAEWQMSMVAKELAKDDSFDVHFLVGDFGQGKTARNIDGVTLHTGHRRGRKALNALLVPMKILSTLISISPDVVIVRAIGVEAGLAALYCRLFGKKFVYSVAHDNDLTGQHFRGVYGRIFKWGLFHADKVVFQTAKQEESFKALNLKSAGPVIPNSFSAWPAVGDSEKDIILWVGRGIAYKRPELFLGLAREFPNERFVMIMPEGDKALTDGVLAAARGLDNLEVRSRTPFTETERYFARAKVFVNTASAEGFPNTFLQAAAYGAPILSLSIDPDGTLSRFGAGSVCLGEGSNREKLKVALGKLLVDRELRESLSAKAKEGLLSGRDIAENIKKWKDMIKGVLKKENA